MSDKPESYTTVARIRIGDRVIAATGRDRDRLQSGIVRRIARTTEIAEIELASGKFLSWPVELIFGSNGETLRA